MAWYADLEPMLRCDVPLAERTTFCIGGSAAFLLDPPDEQSFATAYATARRGGLPLHILGAGSNLLVSDEGVPGVVLSTSKLRERTPAMRDTSLRVGAGMCLARVVRWTAKMGLSGLECLTGIPGTVGGAVRMNAGSADGAIGERVGAIWCAGADGEIFLRRGDEVDWGYRAADIRDPILAVALRLRKDHPSETQERVRTALVERHRSQPVKEPSAGCFFKNPPGNSAGRLIERAGLKGLTVGMACVSPTHANFIVNKGGARASDVLRLRDMVCFRVHERFGILLENEVCCWPRATA